jgi:hypothetical protein
MLRVVGGSNLNLRQPSQLVKHRVSDNVGPCQALLSASLTMSARFDLVVGTLYLMKNPHLLSDFIEFGQLTVYRLMKNLSPELPEYQQAQSRDLAKYDAEIRRLEAKFNKKNFWHGRQILQIAQTIGMEPLYKTAKRPLLE